jgi:hypothetical protein
MTGDPRQQPSQPWIAALVIAAAVNWSNEKYLSRQLSSPPLSFGAL